jgi:hypothetical protein
MALQLPLDYYWLSTSEKSLLLQEYNASVLL